MYISPFNLEILKGFSLVRRILKLNDFRRADGLVLQFIRVVIWRGRTGGREKRREGGREGEGGIAGDGS